jgi:hypothetical protein
VGGGAAAGPMVKTKCDHLLSKCAGVLSRLHTVMRTRDAHVLRTHDEAVTIASPTINTDGAEPFVDISSWGNVHLNTDAGGYAAMLTEFTSLLRLVYVLQSAPLAQPAPLVQQHALLTLNQDDFESILCHLNFRSLCAWRLLSRASCASLNAAHDVLINVNIQRVREPTDEVVVTDVLHADLKVFDTDHDSGFGLRCVRTIRANDVIVEYVGAHVPRCKMRFCNTGNGRTDYVRVDERTRDWDTEYMLSAHLQIEHSTPGVDGIVRCPICNIQGRPNAIDARVFGGLARFIKDETDGPNAQLVWHRPSFYTARPRCFVVACMDIAEGTEISVDYGQYYRRHWLAPETEP